MAECGLTKTDITGIVWICKRESHEEDEAIPIRDPWGKVIPRKDQHWFERA